MGDLQKSRDPHRGAIESQTLKGVRPDIVHEPELRRLRQQIESGIGGGGVQVYSLAGAAVGEGQTSIQLQNNGQLLITGEPGIPVPAAMTTGIVAVSFKADNAPAGSGTLTLWRRPDGSGEFSAVATRAFATS